MREFTAYPIYCFPISPDKENGRILPITASYENRSRATVPSQSSNLQAGEIAPAFTLPDLDGRSVNLVDFRGQQILLLFWNPGCGFCEQMIPDLKSWEAESPPGGLALLVVSTGEINENRALELSSPVLLDEDLTVGPAFGIHGTPMAVLVDAEGKIASDVAVGAPAVLTLARSGPLLARPGS